LGAERSAAFTPLHFPHKQNARNIPQPQYHRPLMRRERRAPLALKSPKPIRSTPLKNLGFLKRERDWKPSIQELKHGFRGWHQRGYLPHFDAPDVTQFVTFHLDDSFPVSRRAEFAATLNEPGDSAKRKQLEAWLDRSYGDCWLRRQGVAEIIEKILRETDGRDYRRQAWVVMPNHVHLVVDVWDVPLLKLINRWKGKSSRLANVPLRRNGKFWQEDYYDTLIRDAAHLKRAIHYTEQNPMKAFLAKAARDWPWSSARHRDEYERLPWQRSE
jgi:REP element-mobilizing transposase RayT